MVRRTTGRRDGRGNIIRRARFAAIAVVAVCALALAVSPSCSGGLIRPLFESQQDFTVFHLQNFSLPALSKDGGVFQFWFETDVARYPVLRFVVVGQELWPPEYHDHDPEDLPSGFSSLGTLTSTQFQFDLPEEVEIGDIRTVFLTVEPTGPDDGVMSGSILLVGGVNVRGRANMTFDADNSYGGLPNVFLSPAGSFMLAIPTNRPAAETSSIGSFARGFESMQVRRVSQNGDDVTPPQWLDENAVGILTAFYDDASGAIQITFAEAEDADSPPVSYFAYWQEGYEVDFEDALVNGRVVALDITGQESAPFSATLTADDIPDIDGPVSVSVLARDSADPVNETEPLAQNINRSNARDWLTVGPGDYMPPTWITGRGIISGSYNDLGDEIAIRFGEAVDPFSIPITYVLYWQAGNELDYAAAQAQGRVIELNITGQEEAPYTATLTVEDIPALGDAVSLAVHARDSAVPYNETPVYFPHPTLPAGNDWLTVVPGDPFYKGIWFVTIPEGETEPVSSLVLPDLSDVPGWAYQAWAFHQTSEILVSLGRFKDPSAPAMDGKGPHAGPGMPFNAPGRDLISTDYDFRDAAWLIFITVEPDPDTSEGGFAWRLLSVSSDPDMLPGREKEMVRFSGSPPFGVVRIL